MNNKIVAIIKPIQFLVVIWAVTFIILGIIGISSIFDFNLYTQMSIEQKTLVTMDQTNNLLEIIVGILLLILIKLYFADFKIHNKDK